MKHCAEKIVCLVIFLFSVNSFWAQERESGYVCRYGFTFEISTQKSWGYGKPVVLSVTPNTSADAAGLKANDIIDSLNGKDTKGYSSDDIFMWLQNSDDRVELKISNLKEKNRELHLNRYCKLSNAITEKDLASVYSFYSLESVRSQMFSCPFKIQINPDIDLLNYETFAFTEVEPNNQELEQAINSSLKKVLEEKGLTESIVRPDLIVHTYYSYSKNPNYKPSGNTDKLPLENRYNMNTKTWETLPVFLNPLIHSNQAQFLLKFGIRLIDPKKSMGENMYVVWELEANELLKSNYPLTNYAQFHIPLMLMNYPYPKSTEDPQYYYSRTNHNYTGINFNMDNMKEIVDVDFSASAEEAGINIGDIIEKINGIKFENNTKSAGNKYKQFILKTNHLRDPKTQFTNADGFSRCMYWDKMKYVQVSDEFRKPEHATAFSYLFYFEPYINLSETNILHFDIKRGTKKLTIRIKPIIVTEEIFENR